MQFAQKLVLPGETGNSVVEGPLKDSKFSDLASVVNAAQTFIFPIAGVLLLAYLVWGGLNYITSAGDPKKAESARAKITHAVVGFIIIFVAYWVVQIVNYVFGLNSL